MLNRGEYLRYSRQISLPGVGVSGQKKLKKSSVAIVGAGGTGSPLALYLTAAGIGHLGIIDFDVVGISNLHRQILHTEAFLGAPKLESALTALQARNPHVKITKHNVRLDQKNAKDILGNYDIIADCSDNFPTRYLVNDTSVLHGIPNVYGSVYQFEGQISVFGVSDGPCYRCLHPVPPSSNLIPTCAESGVLGVLPGLIGTFQASEIIKLLVGFGQSLIGRMALIDTLTSEWHTITVSKNPDCPACGESPIIDTLTNYEDHCSSTPSISAGELRMLKQQGISFFLLDVREAQEANIISMGANQRIPLNELSERLPEITANLEDRIIVHCQTGTRSRQAVEVLRNTGFTQVASLDGGILAWVDQYSQPDELTDSSSDDKRRSSSRIPCF